MGATTKPQKQSIKECIRNFTWAWHTVIMGTGSLAVLSVRWPFGTESLAVKVITLLLFFTNLSLFLIISSATLARYIMFPETWSRTLSHPSQGLFVGAFAMGGATLLNAAVAINQSFKFGGMPFLYVVWAFWWLDLVISAIITFGLLYAMMSRQRHSLDKMASVWLFPVITLTVISSTGGLVAEGLHFHKPKLALITTAISFSVLLMGLSLALMIIAVYLLRLILYGIPDISLILSAFTVVGPLAQSGFSLLINGKVLSEVIPYTPGPAFPHSPLSGEMLYAVCFCGAWALWSMGAGWTVIAVFSLRAVASKEKIPFSVAYWGTIFPNGTFALLTLQLGIALDSRFFHYLGAVLSVLVLILWAIIFTMTIPVVWDRTIFSAPFVSSPVGDSENVEQFERSTESSGATVIDEPGTIEPKGERTQARRNRFTNPGDEPWAILAGII